MSRKKKELSPSEQWKWDIMDVEVTDNSKDRVELYFYWNIFPKKNSKRVFWHTVLPSENYMKRHKIMADKLSGIDWKLEYFPCKILIYSIAWNKMKWDVDNMATSLFDLFTDVGLIPDDNKFVVSELFAKNVGYIRNCPITRVIITNSNDWMWDEDEDHKSKDLKKCKNYLSNY